MFRLFGVAENACRSTLGAKTIASPWMCLRTLSSQTPPRTRRKWSTKEEESLIGLRNSGMTNNQISIELGRSFISVKGCVQRLRRTGAILYTPRKGLAAASFTPQEDSRLLTATQGFRNWDHITKLFPGRSTKSLQARCTLLSRNECRDAPHRHGRYSEEDDARLLYCYHRETLSTHQIAALLSRGYNSVQARFQALRNVHVDDKSPLIKAAATEFKKLKRSGNLPKGFYGTGGACRRWTPQEISQCLNMAAAGIDRGEIASMLHRTRYAVYKMLKRGRPSAVPPGRSRRWTEEEKSKLLALHASGMTSVEIAQQLSRSKGSIDRMTTGCNMIRTMQVKLGKVESGPVES